MARCVRCLHFIVSTGILVIFCQLLFEVLIVAFVDLVGFLLAFFGLFVLAVRLIIIILCAARLSRHHPILGIWISTAAEDRDVREQ